MPAIDAIRGEARRTLFDVLAAMIWSDGRIAEGELDAARSAVVSLGLVDVPTDVSEPPLPLAELRLDGLEPGERRLIYAAAAWVALTDSVESPSETRLLELLQARLALGEEEASSLRARAHGARSEAADRPGWRELDRLLVEAAGSPGAAA